jgi:hypothetical protein
MDGKHTTQFIETQETTRNVHRIHDLNICNMPTKMRRETKPYYGDRNSKK